MAYRFTIPFYAFRLHFRPGLHLIYPLTDATAVRINAPLFLVAGQYAEELQRKVLDKGNIRSLLDEFRAGQFLRDRLSVTIPASRDGLSNPEFDLEFDFYYHQSETGFWGIIPVLGLEAFTTSAAELVRRLQEAVLLDFVRRRRIGAIQEIVATLWFESLELLQHEMMLDVPTPREVEDLTQQPKEQWLPRVAQPLKITRQVTFGREQELRQFERALKNEFSRNVLLVGPSGVGKTALVWEIARQAEDRGVRGKIWETTASTLIKELTRETGWQDNLALLCQELGRSEDLLFIRNLMELFEVGKYEGNELAIADYLRAYLGRGEINLISECTEEELARIDLRSPGYAAFFQVLRLAEPREELEAIILQKVQAIAQQRRITITEDAIREVILLNRRFLPYSGVPGKPIRFLESLLISEKEISRITRSDIYRYFSEDSGMPRFMIDPAIPIQIRAIKAHFNANVFGQERAVDIVVDLLAAVKTALTRTGKPIASLLFVGPTGVGKTELAKVLAQFMFGSRERLMRFDMSEFATSFSVLRLIGTDYFSDGLLTSAVRREPFCVLLFDEIEKAAPDFYDLLLQILSEGRLTDSQGKLVNFCSTIIIMTSNIGADGLQGQRISWNRERLAAEVSDHFSGAVQRFFRPELFNRIDQIISFDPLDPLTIRYVVEREMELFRRREGIRFRRMHLEIEEAVIDFLGKQGYHDKYGARFLQRTIRDLLILPIARRLNQEDPDDQLVVRVCLEKGAVVVHAEADPLGLELLIEELDKISHADHTSHLRRRMHQLREGPLYIELNNELDQLENWKNQDKKTFWVNFDEANRYASLLQTRERVHALTREIETMEQDISMATLQLAPYRPSLEQQIRDWEGKFLELKIELYGRLFVETRQFTMGIYGNSPQRLANFYQSLVQKKKYTYTMQSVWFREAHYSEEVTVSDDEKGNKLETRRRRAEYIKAELSPDQVKNLSPPKAGDVLYGIEIIVTGEGAILYFREEEGGQRWKISEEEEELFVVRILEGLMDTPDKIHRLEFYRTQPPRRIVEPGYFRDMVYQINRELASDERLAYLRDILDRRFEAKLDLAILGEG